uniref:Integrase catalytic domain-containing protein n=1 Tax=Anopheles arabiensis TaxID=7173 RepID=A0A182IER0_ANOAR
MIARLFDPLGLIAPIISWAKIRMQKLWIACHDWDDPLSSELAEEWKGFHANLPLLSDIKIPRYVRLPKSTSMQLHCFADASEAAYGAVMYLRSTDSDGQIKVEILAAKSRPAPLKRISLARLELCAAVMAINLWNHVSKSMGMQEIETFMWSDSRVVLHWLKSPSYTWVTFVANRVSLIQDIGKCCKWMHIRGTENPADVVSRGALPQQLLSSDLWFHGPSWLSSPQEEWKESKMIEVPPEEMMERKKQNIAAISIDSVNWVKRFSCYWKALRFTAYCLRWKGYRRQQNPSREAFITTIDLENAKITFVKMLQNVYFPNDMRELSSGKPVRATSRLKSLHPFIDADGLLRVGGRLQQTGIMYSGKHPLLLPGSSHFAKLIAVEYHRGLLHAGPRATLAEMRKEYWVIDGRRIANSVCKSCVTCFRADPKTVSQPMGQLPESRATPTRPFSVVGVDYCGPFYLKPAAATKAYAAVFVCFAVKAVHLELAEDLSAAAFLAAFRRFVSRRGFPTKVYSDNGLNFRGANTELMELHRLLNDPHHKEAVLAECARNKVEWHFKPPRAPNFGGLWEAAVKSAKRTLRKLFRLQRLSFGEMSTVLVQIEAQMNSRPLTPLSEDPSEVDALTPGHFLIGTALMALPDNNVVDVSENRVRRFQLLQQLVQRHWKRWRTEYLCELHNNNQRILVPQRVAVG